MWSRLCVALCCGAALSGCPSTARREAASPPAAAGSTPSKAAGTDAASAKRIAAALRAKLERLTSYTAELSVVMDASALFARRGSRAKAPSAQMRLHTSLAVQRPRRMWLRVKSKGLSMVAYLDGEHAYVGSQLPRAKGAAMRLSHVAQSKVAPSGRPFDVGINMRGHGLSPGSDLVETLTTMLGDYHFRGRPRRRTVAGKRCREIVGSRTLDQALSSVLDSPTMRGSLLLAAQSDAKGKARRFTGLRGLAQTTCEFLRATSHARVCVGRDGMPLRYVFGREHQAVMTVTITQLHSKVTLPLSKFRPDAKHRAAAADVTPSVQQQRQRMHAASADKVLAAKVEAILRRCGKPEKSAPASRPKHKPRSTINGPLPSRP